MVQIYHNTGLESLHVPAPRPPAAYKTSTPAGTLTWQYLLIDYQHAH